MRALLCFLYLSIGKKDRANTLASTLPHMRESREIIMPKIANDMNISDISENIRLILLGE